LGSPLCFSWVHVGHCVGKVYILVFGENQLGLGCFWGGSMVFGEFLSVLGVILFFLGLYLHVLGSPFFFSWVHVGCHCEKR